MAVALLSAEDMEAALLSVEDMVVPQLHHHLLRHQLADMAEASEVAPLVDLEAVDTEAVDRLLR